MRDPQTVEQVKLGYGDRLTPDGEIEQFAILQLYTRDGEVDYELAPDTLATLKEQVDRVQEALASLRRREARRDSRSNSGWRADQSHKSRG